MSAVVFVGFSRTFFLRHWFPEAEILAAPETFFYIHGMVFTAWMVLLIIQTSLVWTGRLALHRRLGVFGCGLAIVIVVLGIIGLLVAAHRPGGFIGVALPPLQFLALPIFDPMLFGVFVGLAYTWRRHPQSHKRLILLATVNLLEAAIVRIPLDFIGDGAPLMARWLSDIFILALVAWDLGSIGRVHPATLWGGVVIIGSQPLRLLIMDTQPWLAFAHWAVGLLD